MELQFKDGKVFLTVTKLNLISKHSEESACTNLDVLSKKTWETKKKKAKKGIQKLAAELLKLYAQREMARGPSIPIDQSAYQNFAAKFPFDETADQAKAIEEVLGDLEGPKPMDRLVCGDVGYGKTEVAIRAAFSAMNAGYQVALIAPTTLLVAQHFKNFKNRFAGTPFEVVSFSRLNSTVEIKENAEKIKTKKAQLAVGTHKLLSSQFEFSKLGLLIIDEEQRFGVAHKEKLKKLRHEVHVLTLTATPIPRTLNLAMSGLKELSIISTPPKSRLSVKTYLSPHDNEIIREAVLNECKRGGQVFFLHNRISTS